MPQYFTDWRNDITLPSTISSVWSTAGRVDMQTGNPLPGSNNYLRLVSEGYYSRCGWSWKQGEIIPDDQTTIVIFMEYSRAGNIPGPFISGSGNSDSNRTGYVSWFNSNNRLSQYNGGGDSEVASAAVTIDDPFIGYVELKRVGSTIEQRFWPQGGTRSTTPSISYTDSTPLPVGDYVGVSIVANQAKIANIYSIAVGTNGDPAPTAPAPKNLSTTLITDTSARFNWERG